MAIDPEDYRDPLPNPIGVLEELLARAGLSLAEATLRYSFFIDPESVRSRCPYFPDRARMSRQHYPRGDRGDRALWSGREVILGDNARAQMAWAKYTGRPIERGSGYGVRHIWGNPWDPHAFTAGWNLCYMPYWLGMLTEDQHPHPDVARVIQQVSFDLYFGERPVYIQPEYVADPGMDLTALVAAYPVRILRPTESAKQRVSLPADGVAPSTAMQTVLRIRKERSQSWSNLRKAARALSALPHEPFGTPNVESNAKSVVRTMMRESGLTIAELGNIFEGQSNTATAETM
jgi:hypothetical protein